MTALYCAIILSQLPLLFITILVKLYQNPNIMCYGTLYCTSH